MRAECLLALLGRAAFESEREEIDAVTGALFLADLSYDVEQIKRLLTAP